MDSISLTVTGRIGDAPAQGVTSGGKAWASFSLAADVPAPRSGGGEREYQTRWYKIWAYGALAEHVAASLVKGDRVTVRADDLNCRTWTGDGPDHKARAQAELRAYDVAASMRFETLITAKATRQGGAADGAAAGADPWADAGQAAGGTAEVPDVLAGVTR